MVFLDSVTTVALLAELSRRRAEIPTAAVVTELCHELRGEDAVLVVLYQHYRTPEEVIIYQHGGHPACLGLARLAARRIEYEFLRVGKFHDEHPEPHEPSEPSEPPPAASGGQAQRLTRLTTDVFNRPPEGPAAASVLPPCPADRSE